MIHQPAEGSTRDDLHAGETIRPVEVAQRLDGVRVLAVDDELDTRELLAGILGQYGAEVTTANSAQAALELVGQLRPDVLVSDIAMPGRDGYELMRQIRTLPLEQGGRTPAIALTAYARVEDRVQALQAGYQMHLAKPVEPAELVAVIVSLVERNPSGENG